MFRKHWTPRYVIDRLRLRSWQRAHKSDPWLCPPAVAFLEQWLRPTDLVVEFGSGRSTVWFARRTRHIVSIEHHKEWHARVSADLTAAGLLNATYTHVDQPPDPSQPASNDRRLNPELFTQAAQAGLAAITSDSRADMILVDGANRDTTAIWALDHVRPGGLIVVDNANRFLPSPTRAPASLSADAKPYSPLWEQFSAHTADWRRVWFSDGIADTLLVFAPVA